MDPGPIPSAHMIAFGMRAPTGGFPRDFEGAVMSTRRVSSHGVSEPGSGRFRTAATIRDVASRAGVSTATVSRTLSRAQVVSPETRRRVKQVVEELGYAPNAAARNLRTLRSRKLLVTVPDITNPFFALILQGIEKAALRAGYAVLLGDTQHDVQREDRYAQMLLRQEADGLIFLGHRLPKAAARLVRSTAPGRAPVVNGCEFSPALGVPSAHIDNAKAAHEALGYLCRLGHRNIGIITGPLAGPLSRDRLKGTLAQARIAGIRKQLTVIQGDFSIESGIDGARRLLGRKSRPTAVFCFNDEMAMGVLEIARQRGLRVPQDLSVMGFDDIRFARFADPPLTTTRQPMQEIGEATVRLLLGVLRGELVGPLSVTLPHELVIRSSTAPPPPDGVRGPTGARRPRRTAPARVVDI
jgi:LacI family repressor for deo operon, udp, cdd, tsx, nupC, and nupG